MELLEVIKSRAYLAKEYRAENYKEGFEMTIDYPPCSRRIIEYKVVVKTGKKYWQEIRKREFVFNNSEFYGEWKDKWNER